MSRRTLGLGLGLLAALVSMEALLTAGNLRPIFRGMEVVGLFALWVLMQLWRVSRPA